MKNIDEKEKEQRFQQAEEGYTTERKEVPIPDPGAFMEIEQRSSRPASADRPGGGTLPEDPSSSQPESKEIFSEPLSQFQRIDAKPTSTHLGDSEVDGKDQTSPGIEDTRGANRVGAKT
jgi:hypothetical protein